MSDLKTWRTERSLTQSDVAASIGTTVPTISRIEAGEQWPGAELMARIERVTEGAVTASDILARYRSQQAAE